MATNLLKDFQKKSIKTARSIAPIESAGLEKYLKERLASFDKELAELQYRHKYFHAR